MAGSAPRMRRVFGKANRTNAHLLAIYIGAIQRVNQMLQAFWPVPRL
jgi:hypothetical protein